MTLEEKIDSVKTVCAIAGIHYVAGLGCASIANYFKEPALVAVLPLMDMIAGVSSPFILFYGLGASTIYSQEIINATQNTMFTQYQQLTEMIQRTIFTLSN